MKKTFAAVAAAIMTVFASFGASEYEFVTRDNGSSYIKINQNLESFSFKSDFKSIGNSGRVGYVVYPNDLSESDYGSYMAYITENASNPQFGKSLSDGNVKLGSLKSGTRVGFYLLRNNGNVVTATAFVEKNGTQYLEFDKNGGSGKDEWMSIEGVSAVPESVPTGAPLPGALAALLVGGVGAFAARRRRASKAE